MREGGVRFIAAAAAANSFRNVSLSLSFARACGASGTSHQKTEFFERPRERTTTRRSDSSMPYRCKGRAVDFPDPIEAKHRRNAAQQRNE